MSPKEFDDIVVGRNSVRSYLDRKVDRKLVEELLRVASSAPSGNNIQPWRVHVVTGDTLGALTAAVCAAYDAADGSQVAEYDYYPKTFVEPFQTRRRACGYGLYDVLGIAKGDRAAMRAQHRRNFEFFGAPVGLLVSIDRSLALGSWLDCGMFIQNVLLVAQARGLATCAQAAWIDYHRIIADVLKFPPNEQFVCAIAVGYPDSSAPENRFKPARAGLEEYVTFHD